MGEYAVKRPVNRPPIHPGEIVREDVLPALGLSVSEAARRLKAALARIKPAAAVRSGAEPRPAALGGKSRRSSSAVSRRRQRHWLTGSSRKGGNSCMSASFKAGMACRAAAGQAGVGHPAVHALLGARHLFATSQDTRNGTETL